MDANRRLEIEKCIIFYIYDEMKNVFPNLQVSKKELMNSSLPCLVFQFHYNEEFNKVYLYYELDKASKYDHDPYDIALRINSRFLQNFYRDMNANIALLGPYADIKQNKSVDLYDSSDICIRPYTFSYWKCFDGVYRFIEDIKRTSLDRYEYLMKENNSLETLQKEFNEAILDINSRFDFNSKNKTDVILGFEEYCDLYRLVFDRSLEKNRRSRNQYSILRYLLLNEGGLNMSCSAARETDQYHGWECGINGSACMYLQPNSKQCAKEYGEGPDAYTEESKDRILDDIILGEEGCFESEEDEIEAIANGYI